ncbi:MAG: glycosyltransferase family 4 protein [Thermoanaerobaculia bacterium]|nr:glycosyltransferase family 4 protein [Thermoanaerobaculia bacterium]
MSPPAESSASRPDASLADPPTLHACTIVSKNYLCYARVLARSFRRAMPGGRFYVLLVDRNDGHIDPAAETFEFIEAEDISTLDDVASFLFKYTILEANTAIKPFFLEWLIDRDGLENLVYFDPDILITGSLDELAGLVARHAVVLTPHLTDPIEDQRFPTEQAILQAGSNNLGFVALRSCPTSRRLLRWWQERLYDHCVVRIEEGLFVDQKWMDLAAGLFGGEAKDGGVKVHVDPGYNVAYWNLHGRRLSRSNDDVTDVEVRGQHGDPSPLIFFHFSGIDPESLEGVSKHQDRFTFRDLDEPTQALYRHYADLVRAAGYAETRPWPYAFGMFSNGCRIPDLARALYLDMTPAERQRFGDPFEVDGEASFYRWLNEPASGRRGEGHLSRLMARIHSGRPDLRGAYGDPSGADFSAFSSWMRDAGRYEYRLDEAFLTDLHDDRHLPRWTPSGLKRRAVGRVRRIYHSPGGRKLKASLKNTLGPDRTRSLKRRLRPKPVVDEPAAAGPPMEDLGVNLVGYLDAETGMGQAARSLGRAFATTPIPVSRHRIDLNVLARKDESDLEPARDCDAATFPHDINLFVVNADQVVPVRDLLGADVFGGRRNVGLWLWEQDTFPDVWRPAFEPLDEIWTPSLFCVDAISSVSPVPVRRVPLPVEPRDPDSPDADDELRRKLDWPEDAFVFLFVFNYLSFFERKNPLAVVEAFRRAFGDEGDKLLLFKTSQSDFAPERHGQLRQALGDATNIRLVDEYLSRQEVDGLMRSCDAYVSLHRSEGFGLTLAEAMYYGKPVVATAYSGNVDFFGIGNGFPVRHQMVALGDDAGPYARGSRWADPDIDHAAEQMRRVVEDDAERRRVSACARRHIREHLSLEAIGRILQSRFDELVLRARKDTPRRLPH